jgi:hypothetical protein
MLMAQSGDEESVGLGVVVGRLLSVEVLPGVGEAVLVVLACLRRLHDVVGPSVLRCGLKLYGGAHLERMVSLVLSGVDKIDWKELMLRTTRWDNHVWQVVLWTRVINMWYWYCLFFCCFLCCAGGGVWSLFPK